MALRSPSPTRAVVLGASMAGLLAATVLVEHYAEVLVVDRDPAGELREARRGTPQARHTHGLLARGQQVLEDLLPGLTDELLADGVRAGDIGSDIRWYFGGRRLAPARTGLLVVGGERTAIERRVRTRALSLPGITLLGDRDVIGPTWDDRGSRVTGAEVHHRPSGVHETWEADLVVDATGRGSRTPRWLADRGFGAVDEDRVEVGITYTTRRYRLRDDPFGDDVSINPVATPSHPRGAFLTTLGGRDAILSLTGLLGDGAPTDPAGFEEYARSLPTPEIGRALEGAEALDEPSAFRFPASVRRRYERLRSLPGGLVIVGDAACTFNPVYGQGMTVAGMAAVALRDELSRAGTAGPDPRRLARAVARAVDAPWEIATGGDLAFPEVRGRRTVSSRLGGALTARVQQAAASDPAVTEAFLRVAGLVDPPTALMRPSVLRRVLRPLPAAPAAVEPAAPVPAA